jgi:hypothetical protein
MDEKATGASKSMSGKTNAVLFGFWKNTSGSFAPEFRRKVLLPVKFVARFDTSCFENSLLLLSHSTLFSN